MTKRRNKYYVTYVWTIAWDLISWMIVLFGWLFFGKKLQWCEGLWCEINRKSLFGRLWKWGGVTLGHGGFYGDGLSGGHGIDTREEEHEHVHVEQYEVAMLIGFIFAVATVCVFHNLAALIVGGVFWVFSWVIMYAASAVQAWLRGEDGYRGNIFEESAYSQADE